MTDSPEEVYGKVMSISDSVVEDFFVKGTSLPMEQVEGFLKKLTDGENPVVIKRELAKVIVAELCGEEAVAKAVEHFQAAVVDKMARRFGSSQTDHPQIADG